MVEKVQLPEHTDDPDATIPLDISRRQALGQCAQYTGAVVALMTVSKPAWASHGHAQVAMPTANCSSGTGSLLSLSLCADVDVENRGSAGIASASEYGHVQGFGTENTTLSNLAVYKAQTPTPPREGKPPAE